MNKHVNKAIAEEKILESAFKNGVAMAFYSMGKFATSKDEDIAKLREIQDKLYDEFLRICKENLDKNKTEE